MKLTDEVYEDFLMACGTHDYESTPRNLVLYTLGWKGCLRLLRGMSEDLNEMKLNGDGG